MNFILTMFICASTAQGIQCLPPVKFDILYKDGYDCMLDGYTKSHDKIIEIGREEINKNKIFVKFGCYEDFSNKKST
ncbi:MAG: hypothetical protein V3V78_04055 [Candidatus Woesearchaeota archaeon]|jgi:hypothetical protein